MAEAFGARLRRQREQRRIDLTAIAEQTKIKRSLLDALERDDVSQWPSGIFRRAWFRSYARAIGVEDPEGAVREFLEAHPDPQLLLAPQPDAAQAETARPGLRGFVGGALASVGRRMRGGAVQREPAPVEAPASASAVAAMTQERPVSDAAPGAAPEFDLPAIARICTRLGQAANVKDVQPLLQDVAGMLDATGLIVWLWHSAAAVLRPVLVHGYSAGVIARLPAVTRDADNPTAAAFRAGQLRVIEGTSSCGALVVPLLLRSRCVGVLAIELEPGRRLTESARAVAMIVAAALAQLVSRSQPAKLRTPNAERRTAEQPRFAPAYKYPYS
jgi:transcriptional regulator with XRE-family HTH domain